MSSSPTSAQIFSWAVSRSPIYVEPVLVAAAATFSFITRGKERRAATANLRILLNCGWLRAFLRTPRVFLGSAWIATDTLHADTRGDCMDWDIVGLERYHEIANAPTGALLLTARMGSFSVANPAFTHRLGKPVFTVDEADLSTETSLAADLHEALSAGEIIAISGDTVPPGHSSALADIAALRIALPIVPLAAAARAHVPAYPFFIIRTGRRRYQLRVEAPLPPGSDPEASLKIWADTLVTIGRRHWSQWSIFAPLLSPSATPPDTSSDV